MSTIGSYLPAHIALKILLGLHSHLILAVNVLLPLSSVPMETPSPVAPVVCGWGQMGDDAGLGSDCPGPQLLLHSQLSFLTVNGVADPT